MQKGIETARSAFRFISARVTCQIDCSSRLDLERSSLSLLLAESLVHKPLLLRLTRAVAPIAAICAEYCVVPAEACKCGGKESVCAPGDADGMWGECSLVA
jgi:hypothetical protein